jgi:ADP-heptose:LPS heptosyltransferase
MTTARILQRSGVPATRFEAPPRIAVFRALQLGDMLCVVPALRALRAAAPQSHITLIGMPWASSFVERFHMYLDELLVFPGFPGFPEQPADIAGLPRFLQDAQARKFDLAIQLHGSGNLSNPITELLGARHVAGFYQAGQRCPDLARFLLWDEKEHEVLRFIHLMNFLGIASSGNALEFPLYDADHASLRASHDDLPEPGSYVCIHPGARLPSRRWLPQRFAEVADRLAGNGFQVVLTGSNDEKDVVQAVADAMQAQAINLCGRTSLGGLAALIAQARLVVCNDTGISHVAAAVATPSVIICCGSDPVRWAPLDAQRHRVIGAAVSCRPCMHVVCPIGHDCAVGVSVGAVMEVAGEVLAAYANRTLYPDGFFPYQGNEVGNSKRIHWAG